MTDDRGRTTEFGQREASVSVGRRLSSEITMAFFRTVSLSDQMPAIAGDGVMLRAPQMSDYAEWAALREASRDFLTPWEPTWPADDLTRGAFRRRLTNTGDRLGKIFLFVVGATHLHGSDFYFFRCQGNFCYGFTKIDVLPSNRQDNGDFFAQNATGF